VQFLVGVSPKGGEGIVRKKQGLLIGRIETCIRISTRKNEIPRVCITLPLERKGGERKHLPNPSANINLGLNVWGRLRGGELFLYSRGAEWGAGVT